MNKFKRFNVPFEVFDKSIIYTYPVCTKKTYLYLVSDYKYENWHVFFKAICPEIVMFPLKTPCKEILKKYKKYEVK